MTSTAELNQQRKAVLPNGLGVMCDFFVEKARNAELWTTEGKRYIDFAGGIGVLNTGHLHPKVQKAVAEQLEQFSHTCYQVIPYALYGKVAERIAKAAPVGGNAKTFFVTTGAEAVENAIKIARAKTGRRAVIAFQSAYHGRTNFTLGLTGKVAPYKLNFGPFPGDIYHIPFPNKLHNISEEESLNALHKLLKVDVAPSDVAAIIIEPVQGEGGFNVAPFSFLKELRKLCDEHGITLIFDEVQSGFARTGKLFAYQHYDVQPDILTSAKALGSGFPIGAMLTTDAAAPSFGPGTHGTTFGGNPLACAVAGRAFDVINTPQTLEHVAESGLKLQAELAALGRETGVFKEVRGIGLLIGCVLADPYSGRAGELVQEALRHGLMILVAGGDVIRFAPSLLLNDEDRQEGIRRLKSAVNAWIGA